MALPSSGLISIRAILSEMGRSQTTRVSFDTLASEWYNRTGKNKFNSSVHKLSDWYAESWLVTTLDVEPFDISADIDGGVYFIKVTCNTKWNVFVFEKTLELTVDKFSGLGNGSFIINIGTNYSSSSRRGTVRVTAGSIYRDISWSQRGRNSSDPDINVKHK